MTRVRLPPDPDSNCITTIVDSQGGDAALISAVATMSLTGDESQSSTLKSTTTTATTISPNVATGIDHVDSIILVYDLDRMESFYRLENHWLPLIERCYNGEMPVIIAGNKMDLFRPSTGSTMTDEQALARSRQQIVSLMQRFRFVRQCIKCSAKNLLRVDEVFVKAQQAVLYPFTPLYDLATGRLTENCRRALTRIFRMYDRDNDGLLSNAELDAFQNQTFHVPLVERDLAGWKKVVQRNNPTDEAVVQDGKFTVAGFLAIFDVFISQNRLDVPWRVLRKFGYDDELRLHVPSSVSSIQENDKHWKLSSSARKFLAAMFQQFDSDHDGILSADDVAAIFSIIPEPSLPPWHPVRAGEVFEGCFSLPKVPPPSSSSSGSSGSPREGSDSDPMTLSQSLSASGITICSASSLPTVDISSSAMMQPVSSPLTFEGWMGKWHMVSAISPSTARAELFRLGHVEDSRRRSRDSKRRKRKNSGADYPSAMLPSKEFRVLVLGSQGSGKTALLNRLCANNGETSPTATASTTKPETTHTCIKMKKPPAVKGAKGTEDGEEFAVHLVFTEVPEAQGADASKQIAELKHIVGSAASKNRFCDLVVFAFDSSKEQSLAYAKDMEAELLSDEVSRIFVATKGDEANDIVLDSAKEHCKELDLEPPIVTCARESVQRADILEQFSNCVIEDSAVDQVRSKPHAEKKRKEAAKRRKMIWLGGLVSVSVAVAVGVGVLWGGGSSSQGGERKRFGWLRHILGGGIVGMSSANSDRT
jgi:GTPase SAR1 family protein/Ca2+-binding EF-hand superfamily protein